MNKPNVPGATCEYHCEGCGKSAMSEPVPSPPALAVFPLPSGWTLRPTSIDHLDDDLLCETCSSKVGVRVRDQFIRGIPRGIKYTDDGLLRIANAAWNILHLLPHPDDEPQWGVQLREFNRALQNLQPLKPEPKR